MPPIEVRALDRCAAASDQPAERIMAGSQLTMT